MKTLKGKLWAKVVAYILFVASAVVLVAGVSVAAIMLDRGYFIDDGESYYNAQLENDARNYGIGLAYEYFNNACEAFLRDPTSRDFDTVLEDYLAVYQNPARSNLIFMIVDQDTGTLLAESYAAEHRIAESAETVDLYISLGVLNRQALDELLAGGMGVSLRQDWLIALVQTALENKEVAADEEQWGDWGVTVTVTVQTAVNADFPARDALFWDNWLHGVLTSVRGSIFYILPLCLLCAVFFFCFLMAAAGHRSSAGGAVVLNPIDRIPFDLYLIIVGCLFGLLFAVLDRMYYTWGEYLLYGLIATAAIVLLPAVCMTFAARLKVRQLWKNTLIYKLFLLCKRYGHKVWRGIVYLCRRLPLFWKALLAYIGICFIEFWFIIGFSYSSGELLVFWFLEKLALAALLIFAVLNLQALKQGAKALADGNLQHKILTKYMFWEFKNHAEQLNSIGDGMQKAVEAQLKNERLKTELITNVSHDIKTPLTSIINYVDLLKKEELNNETAAGYLEILDRQSARLKKLTEDLVEASKADTGNIPVHFEKTDVSVLLAQVTGEYEEKLAAKNLQIVPDIRSHAQIMADGRLLQRIFENLLGNVCKYAMENTRVYLTCEDDGNEVQISFKNISKYPLNITSDELTERFVRGDSSRNTEGSGLGLSIAKSLARLQNAQLHLYIDGDLFKAMIRFKIAA